MKYNLSRLFYLIGQFSSKPVTGKRHLKMRVVLLNKNIRNFLKTVFPIYKSKNFHKKNFQEHLEMGVALNKNYPNFFEDSSSYEMQKQFFTL